MQKQNDFAANRESTLLKVTAYALMVIYLVNCLTPLRLHVDAIRYFAIRDCIDLGCPPGSEAARDYLPYGYTALLLGLSKLGLLKSFTIVLINCAYLFGGLYLVKKMFESQRRSFLFIILVLLNWMMIKFVTHPLSEMQYLFFSMASLYFFYRFTKSKSWLSLVVAFICGGIAFLTRTVGIALAAALVTGLIWQYRKELLAFFRRYKLAAAAIAVVFISVIVFSKQLGLDHYTGVFTKQFDEGVSFPQILKWHFTEWTELTLNTSIVKVIPFFSRDFVEAIFLLAGILFFTTFVYLVFVRKNSIPFIIKIYILFYSILMFNWPFYDPRFWLPLVPLIVYIAVEAFFTFTKPRLLKNILYAFCGIYVLLGLFSVGYLTSTSLNKEKIARTQANGVYRNEYETVFFGKPQSDTARKTDPFIFSILERYNK
jgi:hypothetical protein